MNAFQGRLPENVQLYTDGINSRCVIPLNDGRPFNATTETVLKTVLKTGKILLMRSHDKSKQALTVTILYVHGVWNYLIINSIDWTIVIQQYKLIVWQLLLPHFFFFLQMHLQSGFLALSGVSWCLKDFPDLALMSDKCCQMAFKLMAFVAVFVILISYLSLHLRSFFLCVQIFCLPLRVSSCIFWF